ncbi:uncharacterized protein LOC127702768 [Mytilus californianus]|uniref:uncharacterized protein LOC127702768 n=1 Tax=Mytilus californianus TaxID=6549 RepID=UPI00224589A9|nr:uncharacterized protein LOC127702768 [Mytilus californianus]
MVNKCKFGSFLGKPFIRGCRKVYGENIISSCNVSGTWESYDPSIEWACRNYDNLYHTFRNVFCYICNPPVSMNPVIGQCNTTGDWDTFDNKHIKACNDLVFKKSTACISSKNFDLLVYDGCENILQGSNPLAHKCLSTDMTNENNFLSLLPVTDTISSVNYRNIYCGLCRYFTNYDEFEFLDLLKVNEQTTPVVNTIMSVCTVLSLVALLFTFITYCTFPTLRTLPGKNNMNLVFSMFFAIGFLEFGIRGTSSKVLCLALGASIHFFWLSTFGCLNVCSIHMYRTFRQTFMINHSDLISIKSTPKVNTKDSFIQHKIHYTVYVKLFVLTGSAWILQILDSFFPVSSFSIIVSFLNSFQGLYIFLAYNCNRRVLYLYQNQFKQMFTSCKTGKANNKNMTALVSSVPGKRFPFKDKTSSEYEYRQKLHTTKI